MSTPTAWPDWASLLLALAGAVVVTVVATLLFVAAVRIVGRGRAWATLMRQRLRTPFVATLLLTLVWIAIITTIDLGVHGDLWTHLFWIAIVLAIAWLIGSLLVFFVDLGLSKYATDGSDGWQARRARTQFLLMRRVIVAAMVIIAVGAALLTLPGVRAVGTTMLASAGLLSVIAGLAAQSTLSNVFAGIQLAFSGALRLEDTVVVNGAWGYVEEITLTYVVVRIWDERRLVLPSTYFTQQSYENWTRHSTALLGTVYFDLDWGVDFARMEAELDRILSETDLWDGEAASLRVTGTEGGYVQIRALISAADAFAMYDLARVVRREMLLWLQKENPEALPRTRIQQIARDGEKFPARKKPVPTVTGVHAASAGDESPFTPLPTDEEGHIISPDDAQAAEADAKDSRGNGASASPDEK